MNVMISLFSFLVLLNHSALAEIPRIVINSPLSTATAGIKAHYLSQAYSEQPKALDLTQVELDALEAFIDDPKIPNLQKGMSLVRYQIGDERVTSVLSKAMKAEMGLLHLITDYNTSFKGKFESDDEVKNSNFAEMVGDDGATAISLRELNQLNISLTQTWTSENHFFDHSYEAFSQPLYNKAGREDQMFPIMHEKEMVLYTLADRAIHSCYFGTANMHGGDRYNRLFESDDQILCGLILSHTERMETAFKAGKPITKVEHHLPERITYADGSIAEVAFTDGKYNPNDRISELLDRATADPKAVQIKTITLSHFVLTNKNVVASIRNLMKAQPNAKVNGVLDQKFISVNGYGKAASLAGFMVLSPMGAATYPFGGKSLRNIHLYGYQRLRDGHVQKTLDGPPSDVFLWHDKTTIVDVTEDGKDMTYIFTGSLNNSAHVANAELQVMFKVPATDKLALQMKKSILEVAATQTEHALPLKDAILRDLLARLSSQSVFGVSKKDVAAFTTAIKTKNWARMEKIINALAAKPSTTTKNKSPKLKVRSAVLKSVLSWIPWEEHDSLAFSKAVAIITASLFDTRIKMVNAVEFALGKDSPLKQNLVFYPEVIATGLCVNHGTNDQTQQTPSLKGNWCGFGEVIE